MNYHKEIAFLEDRISRLEKTAFLGLLKTKVPRSDVRRGVKRLEWMFEGGRHKITSYINKENSAFNISVHVENFTSDIIGLFADPKGGYYFKTLKVSDPFTNNQIEVRNLDEAISLIYKKFQPLYKDM